MASGYDSITGLDCFSKLPSCSYGKHWYLITKGRKFFYDEEGNLAKKIEPGGGTWTYLYFGNGMLREVTRLDKKLCQFPI
ncbi:MAG: hypothetical protein EGP79_01060 [Roseburia intestinalis]|nr:hypothetical protein [Roseburia intestinalis]